jgi:glucose-1-phosphate adenylyltransferase
MKNILAMILAGGRVDELDVLTFARPKSALPFGGLYRIIDFPMSNLMHAGIERVGILSQYRPFSLINHIANGQPWDMIGRNRFAIMLPPFKGREASDWYKGTADAVYQNLDFLKLYDVEVILILSGDHIYNMDYQDLIDFHVKTNADLTAAFTPMPSYGAHRFGQGHIDSDDPRGGKLVEYVEKPSKKLHDWASLTIYAFKPKVLMEALEDNAKKDSHEFGKDIIPSLLGGSRVFGYKYYGYWGYTRTLEEYWQTNMDLLGENQKLNITNWQIRTNMAHSGIRDRQPARIGTSAIAENSLFYAGCDIKGYVSNSILFPGVKIEKGAVVEDSILFFDTIINKQSHIARVIADKEVHIGSHAVIGEKSGKLTVIGMKSSLPDGIHIQPGVAIHPQLEEDHFTRSDYMTGEIVR